MYDFFGFKFQIVYHLLEIGMSLNLDFRLKVSETDRKPYSLFTKEK